MALGMVDVDLVERVLIIGVGAGGRRCSEKGKELVGGFESVADVTRIGLGDCSGVGTGRRRGRRGASREADLRLALYLRASLDQKFTFV
jgi:hypothetical protein